MRLKTHRAGRQVRQILSQNNASPQKQCGCNVKLHSGKALKEISDLVLRQ